MPWPFTSVAAPNLDTGPGVDVPNTPTEIVAGLVWLLGGHFSNHSGGDLTLTIVDTAGAAVYGPLLLPDGAEISVEWPFRPVTTPTWSGDNVGIAGHVWGYK